MKTYLLFCCVLSTFTVLLRLIYIYCFVASYLYLLFCCVLSIVLCGARKKTRKKRKWMEQVCWRKEHMYKIRELKCSSETIRFDCWEEVSSRVNSVGIYEGGRVRYWVDRLLQQFYSTVCCWFSYWSLSDTKSPPVSKTHLTNLKNALVLMVSTCPLISKSYSPFAKPLRDCSEHTSNLLVSSSFSCSTVCFFFFVLCQDLGTYLSFRFLLFYPMFRRDSKVF